MTKIWQGDTTCDFCRKEIQTDLYDAATVHGPWATMCHRCWATNCRTKQLGVGMGQHYKKSDSGQWLKVGA